MGGRHSDINSYDSFGSDESNPDKVRVYVYIRKSDLPNVMSEGLLSPRKLSELYPEKNQYLVNKYKSHMEASMTGKSGEDLISYLKKKDGNTEIENTLNYLDWTDEYTYRGSYAVAFLFHPIPTKSASIVNHIRKYRNDFLKNRQLISFSFYPQDYSIQIIASGYNGLESMSVEDLFEMTEEDWIGVWKGVREEDKKLKKIGNELMKFAGIPHGRIIPDGGLIKPNDIVIH